MYAGSSFNKLSSAICRLGIARYERAYHDESATGFAIAIDQNRVIALTARHVIENLFERARGSTPSGRIRRNLDYLGPTEGRVESLNSHEQLSATFVIEGKAIYFFSEFISFGAGDVALLILRPATDMFAAEQVSTLPLAISFNIGPKLSMMGFQHDQDEFRHELAEGGYLIGASIQLVRLHGKLIETMYSREQYQGFIEAPSFTTDIPIGGGFSGSPILSYQPLNVCEPLMHPLGGIGVCGIASSELPGSHSTCTHISSVFDLEFESSGENVLDWLQKGKIRWVGEHHPQLIRLERRGDENMIHLE